MIAILAYSNLFNVEFNLFSMDLCITVLKNSKLHFLSILTLEHHLGLILANIHTGLVIQQDNKT